MHDLHVGHAGAPQVSVLLITGTVGAGKTAVALEIGDLLRLTGQATGMRMGCGVIDLDALSYVAAGPVDEVEAYRDAIPSAIVTVCRLTAPAETVQDRLRRPECGIARDFLMALSHTLAAEIDELAFEDSLSRTDPIDRSPMLLAR